MNVTGIDRINLLTSDKLFLDRMTAGEYMHF